MKNSILFTLFVSICFSFTSADSNKSKALTAQTVRFLGINYSQLKCIHKVDFVDKLGITQCQSLVDRYITEWNEYFITEKEKFDATKFFLVTKVELDLAQSIEAGKNYSVDSCVIENEAYTIAPDKIKSIVKSYQNATASGVAILIIGESLNKQKGVANYYVTYLDIATGELLYYTKISGSPVGYGFAPYWVNSLYNALNENKSTIKKERSALGVAPKSNW